MNTKIFNTDDFTNHYEMKEKLGSGSFGGKKKNFI